jgi:uncharacterized protein YdiU (UPF0061 family)
MPNKEIPFQLDPFAEQKHSFLSLGHEYSLDIAVEHIEHSRLVLFNRALAEQLNLALPESDERIEQLILNSFAWFKYDKQDSSRTQSKTSPSFFATRYMDSADKSVGSALGDGRAIWVAEIINESSSEHRHATDVVLKGTGSKPLNWFNHPKENHKDGQLGLTEAVHEYIYSAAAKINGINTGRHFSGH